MVKGLFTVAFCLVAFGGVTAVAQASVSYTTTNPQETIGELSSPTPDTKDVAGDGTYVKKGFSFYDNVIRSNTLLGGYDDIGKEGPVVTAAKIVNFLLTMLGTVALALMVYAGFLWMTAQGNEDQVTKARGILMGTVLGLFVVLASYSLMSFIFYNFVWITN